MFPKKIVDIKTMKGNLDFHNQALIKVGDEYKKDDGGRLEKNHSGAWPLRRNRLSMNTLKSMRNSVKKETSK